MAPVYFPWLCEAQRRPRKHKNESSVARDVFLFPGPVGPHNPIQLALSIQWPVGYDCEREQVGIVTDSRDGWMTRMMVAGTCWLTAGLRCHLRTPPSSSGHPSPTSGRSRHPCSTSKALWFSTAWKWVPLTSPLPSISSMVGASRPRRFEWQRGEREHWMVG